MSDSTGRLALITGASAGIGSAFAEFLAQRGFDLMLVARREDRLEEIAGRLRTKHRIKVVPFVQDLSRSDATDRIMKHLEEHGRTVDVLINNAGYALSGSSLETPWHEVRDFLEVLMLGQLELMHRVLPGMRTREFGRVINVTSLAAFAPESGGGLYVAAKKFMVSASWAAWLECRDSGVHVTASCPGYTLTEFHDVLGNRESMNRMPSWMWSTSERVVADSWKACEANRPQVVIGKVNAIIRTLCHLLPRKWLMGIAPKPVKARGYGSKSRTDGSG